MAMERRLVSEQAEAVICQLRDVISARVVFGAGGEIEEIHVLTHPVESPKHVVRDIESALQAHLDLRVDHRKISVAQVQGPSERAERPRLKVVDVSVLLNGSHAQAKVRLTRDGVVSEGGADGHNSATGQLRQIAAATLRAIEEAHAVEGALVLEDLDPGITISGKHVVLVGVNWISDRGEELLVGSAVVKQDIWRTAVNATLDAVNRRLNGRLSEG